ncbi:MAG: hypothetical protein M1358_23255 [Chloroflexi bacterium]|nr:hypothetical protein [Chloroflexota bacterium]
MKPRKPIRRFDVFAEYNRIKNEQRGMDADRAKGYAVWLAKVIAARKFAQTAEGKASMMEKLGEGTDLIKKGAKYLEFGGEPQTGEVFDKLIVRRMGEDFYRDEFSPAIREAIENHRSYEKIRDGIRERWNVAQAA